jgi:D-3-phosphoglycerate dehydrogenase
MANGSDGRGPVVQELIAMRILVAADLPEESLKQLRALATDVVFEPGAATQTLPALIENCNVLIVGETRVSADAIRRANALQMIIHAGPGPGDIAIEEASAEGIFVTHCPETHAVAVAELTFGLILALDRRIVENHNALHAGRWTRSEFGDARGLAGQTLGILGYGTVGQLLARRARAFDMNVLAWSPTLTNVGADVELCNWPRELARRADVLTVHRVPGDERTTQIDAEFLQSMKPGAYLVHVGHPGAADEAALSRPLSSAGCGSRWMCTRRRPPATRPASGAGCAISTRSSRRRTSDR